MENKEKKIKGGRKPTPYPEGWEHIYTEWQSGEFSSVEACRILNLPKGTFYNMAKRYESQKEIIGVRHSTARKRVYKGQDRVASVTGRYADLAKKYSDYLERNVLPYIDYQELNSSYQTHDMGYAKGIYNILHQAMLKIYGSENLDKFDKDIDYAVNSLLIPGVMFERGEIRLTLLLMSLNGELISFEHLSSDAGYLQEVYKNHTSCIYGYTAKFPKKNSCIKKQPEMLNDFLLTFKYYQVKLLCSFN